MIQHIAELGVFLLLAFVGVGLVAAFIIGLLGIWATFEDEPFVGIDAFEHSYMLRELVERGMLTIGPQTRDEAFVMYLNEALRLDAPFSWPLGTSAFPFDWERDV